MVDDAASVADATSVADVTSAVGVMLVVGAASVVVTTSTLEVASMDGGMRSGVGTGSEIGATSIVAKGAELLAESEAS